MKQIVFQLFPNVLNILERISQEESLTRFTLEKPSTCLTDLKTDKSVGIDGILHETIYVVVKTTPQQILSGMNSLLERQ